MVNCLELILLNGKIGEIYNIGLGEEISIINLAKKLIKMIKNDNEDKYLTYIKDREFNDKRYYISDEKIKLLGWERKIDLDVGLYKTFKWFLYR